MKIFSLPLLLLLVVGCESIETRSYDVSLKNDSSKPVTIWLTKNGPKFEEGWKSPEDLAIESPKMNEKIAGVVVQPGKTASTGNVTGHFVPHVDAVLRVYLGQKDFNELLATNRESLDRTDVVLKPGVNRILVKDDGGGVSAALVAP
jgi:hypothetical protein